MPPPPVQPSLSSRNASGDLNASKPAGPPPWTCRSRHRCTWPHLPPLPFWDPPSLSDPIHPEKHWCGETTQPEQPTGDQGVQLGAGVAQSCFLLLTCCGLVGGSPGLLWLGVSLEPTVSPPASRVYRQNIPSPVFKQVGGSLDENL